MKSRWNLAAGAILLAAVGMAAWQSVVTGRLQRENEQLRREIDVAQGEQAGKTQAETARRDEELERLKTEAREILKLRNEVSQLRQASNELSRLRQQVPELEVLRAENQRLRAVAASAPAAVGAPDTAAALVAKENWNFSGYGTPEAALQSVVWAMREGDPATFLAALTPEEQARVQKEWGSKSMAEVGVEGRKQVDKLKGFRVLEREQVSEDEVVLTIYAEGGEGRSQKMTMKRVGADWRLGGPRR